jgi:hypothetical protein
MNLPSCDVPFHGRESSSRVPWAVAPGASLFPVPVVRGGSPMADQPSPVQFEDVPLEETRRMGRGPRMEPMLYDTRRRKIQALSSEAVRIHLGPEITPHRMKNYLLRIARDLNVPVTIRRVPGGLLFWRSTDDDVRQAKEVAARLQSAQPSTRPAACAGTAHLLPGGPCRSVASRGPASRDPKAPPRRDDGCGRFFYAPPRLPGGTVFPPPCQEDHALAQGTVKWFREQRGLGASRRTAGRMSSSTTRRLRRRGSRRSMQATRWSSRSPRAPTGRRPRR